MAAALQASAPRIVGRYVLYGEIASGGMATVHFGRLIGPAGFARPVAIKRLHAQFARDPDFVKMFFDEARLAARIAHPNVVPTLDVVAADDEVFLVMDYVRGATLAQLIRTVRRRGDRVQPLISVGIVSGMLHGLHAAHEARDDRGDRLDLVHRDVSPQNVLVGTDGVPRLLDFGVAKASGRLQTTRDGQLKGKLAYMAPEQVRADPLTRRTDIYAASVVLWEVLTGKRLFYAENEASVLARVLNADVPAPSSIVPSLPRSFDRVVLRGLERDPGKRYATAREMAVDLDAVLGVASPTEIGEWVERTATDELRERAALISEIERSAAEAVELPPTTSPPSGKDRDAGSGKRAREAPSAWHQTTKREGVPFGPRDVSQVSSLSLARGSEPPGRPSRKLVSAIVASAGAVVLLLGLLVVSQARSRRGDARADQAVSAATKSSHEVPHPGGDSVTNVEDLPRALVATSPSAAPADEVPAPRPPVRTGGPPPVVGQGIGAPAGGGVPRGGAVAPVTTAPAASAAATAPAASASATAGASDCNPPYTADAKGHIHFKPNCM
jgi:eukaryotic-like serine/threonine-protein kinase